MSSWTSQRKKSCRKKGKIDREKNKEESWKEEPLAVEIWNPEICLSGTECARTSLSQTSSRGQNLAYTDTDMRWKAVWCMCVSAASNSGQIVLWLRTGHSETSCLSQRFYAVSFRYSMLTQLCQIKQGFRASGPDCVVFFFTKMARISPFYLAKIFKKAAQNCCWQ